MGLENAVQGAKNPSQLITWTDQDGNAQNLTNATITARIKSKATDVAVASDGAFIITDAANGVFRWDYGTADLAAAGEYWVQFTATYSSGSTPAKTRLMDWTVHLAI